MKYIPKIMKAWLSRFKPIIRCKVVTISDKPKHLKWNREGM